MRVVSQGLWPVAFFTKHKLRPSVHTAAELSRAAVDYQESWAGQQLPSIRVRDKIVDTPKARQWFP